MVTGMRRVGKTTLLKHFFAKTGSPNKIFLDLEDPLNQAVFEKKNYQQIKVALEQQGLDFSKPGFIFLDEIQLAPALPSVVKYFYDHYQIKFFLTGSASFYLKNLFSESLAGRKYLFELFPLDFEEFLWFKNLAYKLPAFEEKVDQTTYGLFAPLMEEYLSWGGMPEMALTESPSEKEQLLRDIFSSYFQKEVQALGDFRKNEIVRSLILLLSQRVGQKLDIKRLSSELGVARSTIYEYLEFLVGTYFISLIPALGKVDTALRKQRKVYFLDTGFFSFLTKPPAGSVFENVVFMNLRLFGGLSYFQKASQEIDFVLRPSPERKAAFEVKETATPADIKRVEKIARKLGIRSAFVVSKEFSREKEAKYLFQLVNFMQLGT